MAASGVASARCAGLEASVADYDRPVLGKNAKIDLLKRVPLFSGCSKSRASSRCALSADELDLRDGQS